MHRALETFWCSEASSSKDVTLRIFPRIGTATASDICFVTKIESQNDHHPKTPIHYYLPEPVTGFLPSTTMSEPIKLR